MKAARPTRIPAAKKQKAMMSQMTPHTDGPVSRQVDIGAARKRTLGRAAPADLSERGGVRAVHFAVDRVVYERK